ncbi:MULTISPECIES: PucR family transcriptional regulator [Bacillus]|uniref:PucR family transcriptional regulator n=1 Tax=Bacillus TaxID=1386 RepID=UPI0002F7CBDA|nr:MULTISPECIES: PucR family transcriptional regulator [Bacillus]
MLNFTVANALKTSVLDQFKVVAGEQGLNRMISSVSIMDNPDISLIKSGELLLTTGYVFKDDLKAQVELVGELAKRGCAGLAIKVHRFLTAIPEEMILEANRYRLPILVIPYEAPLSDLLYSLTKEIILTENTNESYTRKRDVFNSIIKRELTDSRIVSNQLKELGFYTGNDFIVLRIESNFNGERVVFPYDINDLYKNVIPFIKHEMDLNLISVELDYQWVIVQNKRLKVENRLSNLVKFFALQLEKYVYEVYPGHSLVIGISKEKHDILKIPEGFEEANKAIRLGLKDHLLAKSKIFEFCKFEVDSLLSSIQDNALAQFVESTLSPIIQYDKDNNGELVKTLEIYLFSRGKMEDTSRALFVHRNTVKFRLAKIEELLSIDLRDGEVHFRLQLSLKAAKLLGMTTGM